MLLRRSRGALAVVMRWIPAPPPPPLPEGEEGGTRRVRDARARGLGCQAYFTAAACLEQSRGVMFFSLAYLSADSLYMSSSISRSGWIQSDTNFQCWPSHCWMRTLPLP